MIKLNRIEGNHGMCCRMRYSRACSMAGVFGMSKVCR